MNVLDGHISSALDYHLSELSTHFPECEVIAYYGDIHPIYLKIFLEFVEKHAQLPDKKQNLVMILNTSGGIVEAVEKMVEVMRHHYEMVHFIVPEAAMSAGTILCMSGDKIYMDYYSSLGPIDPQVQVGDGRFVPALGYLDKVNELLKRAERNELTDAEFIILQNQDLGVLRRYEQARDLSVSLLKEFLVNYKFKNWTKHRSSKTKKGKRVTPREKAKRAEEIAAKLGDNKLWHSHGRMLGINTLRKILKLEIEDYTNQDGLRQNIRVYNDLLTEYVRQNKAPFYLHGRAI